MSKASHITISRDVWFLGKIIWENHPLTLFVNMTVRHLIDELLLDTLYLVFMSYGTLDLLASPLLVK